MITRTKRLGLGWCIALACAFILAQAPEAQASDAGFILEVNMSNKNTPSFGLENTSAAGWELTDFILGIGDTAFEYDYVDSFATPSDGGAALIHTVNLPNPNTPGGTNSDTTDFDFTGFNPADQFTWRADIDTDGLDDVVTTNALFNNGGASNAFYYLRFENGRGDVEEFRGILPDQRTNRPDFNRIVDGHQLPEPASLALLGIGALGFAIRRRRKA